MAEWHVRDGGKGSGEYDRHWEVWEGDACVSTGHTLRIAHVTAEAHNFSLMVLGLEAEAERLRAAIIEVLCAHDRGDTAGAIDRLRAALDGH